ncbi:MAG: GNAT family N-acetyltransferase [Rhodospirillales bacterium]|nr:GNAT family N-acetyltransferase [Rhodospirillales bacterium]
MKKENISIRALGEGDWQIFRDLRLKALQTDSAVFSSTYEQEKDNDENDWKSWFAEGKRVFGLFDGKRMIGLTGVFTRREDQSGRTGIMAASYIEKEYRGYGLSRLLYEARLDWARQYRQWDRLVISHRKSNEVSRRANQAFGFKYTGSALKNWPDGKQEEEMKYELDLNELRKGESHDRRYKL